MAVLPKLTPATDLGARFVDGYANFAGIDRDAYLAQLGPTLTTRQVAESVMRIVADPSFDAPSYLLTPAGLQELV